MDTQDVELLFGSGMAELGPGPRSDRFSMPELDRRLRDFFAKRKAGANAEALIRSLVLLWHDYLDESHSLSQRIQSADGSYVHGIMHRREPDYSNAKYWFRRVGRHVCFAELTKRAGELPSGGSVIQAELVSGGAWDPFAFVEACERLARRPADDPGATFLRQLQRVEFEILLAHFCR